MATITCGVDSLRAKCRCLINHKVRSKTSVGVCAANVGYVSVRSCTRDCVRECIHCSPVVCEVHGSEELHRENLFPWSQCFENKKSALAWYFELLPLPTRTLSCLQINLNLNCGCIPFMHQLHISYTIVCIECSSHSQ